MLRTFTLLTQGHRRMAQFMQTYRNKQQQGGEQPRPTDQTVPVAPAWCWPPAAETPS